MKKTVIALLGLASFLIIGEVWASKYKIEQDTLWTRFLQVTEGYDLLGSGGAGYADSLRDSEGTTHAADLYPRKDETATIDSVWEFPSGLKLYDPNWIPNGAASPRLTFGVNEYLEWLGNWNKFLLTRSLEVQGTIECESLNATNSNILGMTIYSGDSSYTTDFWLMQGANMSFTYTDSGVQLAASGTTGAATADSLLDGTTYHSGDEYLRLSRDGTVTGTQTFTTDPILMGDAIKDSMVEDDITIDIAEYAKKSDTLGTYGASDYPRKTESATIDSLWVFLSVLTCSNNFVLTGSLGTGGDTIPVASFLNAVGGHNLTLDTAQYAVVADSAETTAFAWTLPNSSILWDWLNSAVQESATKGVLAIKSTDSTYTGNVYMLGGTGITIDQNDTGITITASGTTTVSIAESLDVGGTPYEGDDFTRRNANESIANLWTFVGGIDVDGNILADGGVYVREDATIFEVKSNDIRLGDDKASDVITAKAKYRGYNDITISQADDYDPKGTWSENALKADLIVEGGANISEDSYFDQDLEIGGDLTVAGVFPYQTINANNGLTGTGATEIINLAVGAGDGIDVSDNAIAVDVTDLLGTGLEEEVTNNLAVKYGTIAGMACEGNDSRLPTSDEKSALGGEGTPSGANKFTTKSYTEATYANKAVAESVTAPWHFYDAVEMHGATKNFTIEGEIHANDDILVDGALVTQELALGSIMNPGILTTDMAVEAGLTIDGIDISGLEAGAKDNVLTSGGGITITPTGVGDYTLTGPLGTSIIGSEIVDGTIENSDVHTSANIARDKIAATPAWSDGNVADNLTISSSGNVDARALSQMTWPIYSDFLQASSGAGDSAASASIPNYSMGQFDTLYLPKVRVAFFKHATMNFLNVRFNGKRNGASGSGFLKISCGSQDGTALINTNNWTGYLASAQISSLSTGSFYEVVIYLKNTDCALGVTVKNIYIYGATSSSL